MLEWLAGALLGFLGEFLRDLYNDYVARSALRESGRLAQKNAQLKEQIKIKDRAKVIRDKVHSEKDFNAVIDGL